MDDLLHYISSHGAEKIQKGHDARALHFLTKVNGKLGEKLRKNSLPRILVQTLSSEEKYSNVCTPEKLETKLEYFINS